MEPAGPSCSSTNNGSNTAYNQLTTPSNSNFSKELTDSPPLVPTHFLYLPPGLGLTLSKNGETSSGRDDFQVNPLKSRAGVNSSPTIRKSNNHNKNNKLNTTPLESQDVSTTSSSRKGSSSSSRSNLSFTSQNSTASTNNSPPSSIESSITSSSTSSSRRMTKDSGEDQALYDARRALWDECIAGDDEISESDRQAVSIFTDTPTDSEVDVETEDDDEDGEKAIGQLDEDIDKLDLTPTTSNTTTIISKPSHATLSPHSSCLRLPSTTSFTSNSASTSSNLTFFSSSTTNSRSSSASFQQPSSPSSSILSLSSVCTTNSVQFSLEPPQALETYSPEEYERGGDPPLEKLSMRDCIELHRLRECVGLWSGKIKKWEPEVELQQQQLQLESALSSPTFGNVNLPGGESSIAPRTTRMDSYCSLSGMTGVTTLCHSDS